jgi:hypothetical protein
MDLLSPTLRSIISTQEVSLTGAVPNASLGPTRSGLGHAFFAGSRHDAVPNTPTTTISASSIKGRRSVITTRTESRGER